MLNCKTSLQWMVLTVLCSTLLKTEGSGIPLLFTRGTHFEVGQNIGHYFKEEIVEYLELHPVLRPLLVPWYKTPEGKKIYDMLLNVATQNYPQYIEEMKGIANGSNQSFVEIFLLNYSVELTTLIGSGQYTSKLGESCSDILVNHPDAVIIGHNEDNITPLYKRGFFVEAHIKDSIHGKPSEEQFTSYCYPGELPGNAFNFNQDGLTIGINALFPKYVNEKGTGRQILSRALLAAKNIDDVKQILTDAGTGATYGFSANIGIISKTNNSSPEVWNVEVAPSSDKAISLVNLYKVEKKNSSGASGNYFHVNIYRRLNIDEIPDHKMSSEHRTTEIKSYPPPSNLQEVLTILGDTKDPKYPIYRTPRPTDKEYTVASAVFDLKKCVMFVYDDNPKSGQGPLHVFNLPCHS